MIFFPPGKTITQGGSNSCQPGGFCAYHGTTSTLLNGKNVLYGVMPDMQSGLCSTGGCGNGGVFGNYTSVTSHELTEAITDADVGIATIFAPPLAWYDMVNGEIGDICNGQQGSYTANGTTYTIQLEFSNAANNCVLPPPAPTGHFSIAASPASQTVTAGRALHTPRPSLHLAGSPALLLQRERPASGASASFNPDFCDRLRLFHPFREHQHHHSGRHLHADYHRNQRNTRPLHHRQTGSKSGGRRAGLYYFRFTNQP